MQATTDGLRRLFGNKNSSVRLMRNIGLGVTNKLPFFKNSLVRYALGSL
jgi:2-polyprenyl-6-methoxyphenol hydroxylase-like FAD-dependent oxidoreductase